MEEGILKKIRGEKTPTARVVLVPSERYWQLS